MKVYILMRTENDWERNASTIVSVHSTLEGAQAGIDEPKEVIWREGGARNGELAYWDAPATRKNLYEPPSEWEIEMQEVKP